MVRINPGELIWRFVAWQNPLTGSPSAPLESVALVDAYTPSLMPRSSVHQGIAAALSVLAARSVGVASELVVSKTVGHDAPYALRMGVRSGIGLAGLAASRIPRQPDEDPRLEPLRGAGRLAMAGAAGGALFDTGKLIQQKYPAGSVIRPLIGTAAGVGGLAFIAKKRLGDRHDLIQSWTAEDKRATLPGSIGVGIAVTTVGMGLAKGFVRSRNLSMKFFGDAPQNRLVGRAVNAAAWAGAATFAYQSLVGYIGRANEKVEAAYDRPPQSPLVSGSAESLSPFDELGMQGRRFVSDALTTEEIEETMSEPAIAEPIRCYVGFNSEPIYASGRAEIALAELHRTRAFDRKYLLLVAATGTGWVDQTMIESAEFFAKGDIASVCVQYGRYPSFLSLQKVALGRAQFRQLLLGVRMRLSDRPPEKRPKVLVFGESLGAWASSDVIMHQGSEGFDWYGIDRALWVGLPGLAKWSKTGMRRGRGELVSAGTVRAFDRIEQYAELSDEDRSKLRALVLDHDNDPIAVIDTALLLKRPDWLEPDGERGRGVPDSMQWQPLITFVQTAIDAMNAMVTVPGEFKSFGHDYRADMARFVQAAYGFEGISDSQIEAVDQKLREMEIERGERIARTKETPEEIAEEEGIEGALSGSRTKGPNWVKDRDPVDLDAVVPVDADSIRD
jgi:uncharacterized membrane protein